MPIEGLDVSGTHQGVIDWRAVAASGIRFSYCKATEGSTFTDRRYFVNMLQAAEAGIHAGAYHFYRHDVDPTLQAAHFIATIGVTQPGELPPMLDVEGPGDGGGQINYPIEEVPDRLDTFLRAVDAATGRKCGIYTYYSLWRNTLRNPTRFTDRPLWFARYAPAPGALPGGWQTYAVWQYTSTGACPGVVGRVDRNRFNGDEAALRAFAGLAPAQRSRYFPETGQFVAGGFLELYEQTPDAVQRFGFPLTGELSGDTFPFTRLPELAGRTVQLFERALFHYRAGEQPAADGRVGALVDALVREAISNH